ncbi:DNA mismatch repair endonuclease MutL [Candidatus Woesearchaeota archaeon]|nr:DNA mismatch repair endonuclease MutL [Nanoarchaeota archaeon]MCB9370176.1 DNA mismatch repair endonuclease MutL [Candidatus Woesearchaeota archaeon]USN44706.1 MAG: DNA mismatch repair endonuclease MutL [Candidatus Woesearchaeota archaeon]
MTIEKLPQELVNQIAAGEVIENPSAILKELIENSIDAKANSVEIELEKAGFSFLLLSDNGIGIAKEELPKAILRHATSKIKSFSDLYSISTMGFRGEALASIFAVAKAELHSKTKNEEQAYMIDTEENIKESAGKEGTTLLVKDLFYNTPARKKYLRSENLELKECLDVLRRYELSHPNIKFTLKNNNKLLVNKPAFQSEVDNISYVLDPSLRSVLVPLNAKTKGLEVKGYFANPAEKTASFRKNQFIFVNHRYVVSKLIQDAVYDGFGTNLMVGRHPIFVLFLEIDPEIIDVNVHPTKIEIRFENEAQVYEIVKNAVKQAFEKNSLFKSFERKEVIEENLPLSVFDEALSPSVPVQKRETGSQTLPPEKKSYGLEEQRQFTVQDEHVSYSAPEPYEPVEEDEELHGPLYDELKAYHILGQINRTYIVISTPTDMILVDQHVASEKYLFEEFKKNLEGKKAPTQKLLKAQVIHLENPEMLLFKENQELLQKLGFDCEEFGEGEILVRTLPFDLHKRLHDPNNIAKYLHEILFGETVRCVEEAKHAKLASMACRSAIMAGDLLSEQQMKEMVERLRRMEHPFNCPHGRPTFLRYPYKELDRKFKRT